MVYRKKLLSTVYLEFFMVFHTLSQTLHNITLWLIWKCLFSSSSVLQIFPQLNCISKVVSLFCPLYHKLYKALKWYMITMNMSLYQFISFTNFPTTNTVFIQIKNHFQFTHNIFLSFKVEFVMNKGTWFIESNFYQMCIPNIPQWGNEFMR